MLSVIIPIYNRPLELDELLKTLTKQTQSDFEVIVVEDGSDVASSEVVAKYAYALNIRYVFKENGGPASARNAGVKIANGKYVIFLDSDTIVPKEYIARAEHHFSDGVLFWGGADAASGDFSTLQKAISYSMTSLFTTSGIRGSKAARNFMPRSFNMGITKALFNQVGGFSQDMRYGEDIDLSMRVTKTGITPQFLPDLTVYHKRRNTIVSFFRQVEHFGGARIELNRRYRESRRTVFWLPAIFTVGSVALIGCTIWLWWAILPLGVIMLTWFVDSTIRNRSIKVGAFSVVTSFVQLTGYGLGFLRAMASRSK